MWTRPSDELTTVRKKPVVIGLGWLSTRNTAYFKMFNTFDSNFGFGALPVCWIPTAVSLLATTTLRNPYSTMFQDGIQAFYAFVWSDFHWSKTIRYFFFSSPRQHVADNHNNLLDGLMPPPMVLFHYSRCITTAILSRSTTSNLFITWPMTPCSTRLVKGAVHLTAGRMKPILITISGIETVQLYFWINNSSPLSNSQRKGEPLWSTFFFPLPSCWDDDPFGENQMLTRKAGTHN